VRATARARLAGVAAAACAASLGWARPAAAQEGVRLELDTASLAAGPFATMSTRLEKTIFRVDVLDLTLRFGPETAGRLETLVRARPPGVEDSVARAAVETRDAFARIVFLREVRLGPFVDGVRENMRKAREAGILAPEAYDAIAAALPRWFAFLEERRIRKGDQILYRIRDDSLRTVFLGGDGHVWLDQVDVGPERRLAVLGSYFARGSDFRDGLVRSLLEAAQGPRGGGREGSGAGGPPR
jgi:hypothetical protein